MKRVLDVVLGTLLAIVAVPIIVLLSLCVAVSLRAWPLFSQERIGAGGKRFRMIKLRTLPPSTPEYASKDDLADLKVSPLCRFLRKHHLDELPQLLLVPVGAMSLVGPRPKMPDDVEPIDPLCGQARVSVPQGCTGLWQIGLGTDRPVAESPTYDLFYLNHFGLKLDAWIIWRTLLQFLGASPVGLQQVPKWARRTHSPGRCADPGMQLRQQVLPGESVLR